MHRQDLGHVPGELVGHRVRVASNADQKDMEFYSNLVISKPGKAGSRGVYKMAAPGGGWIVTYRLMEPSSFPSSVFSSPPAGLVGSCRQRPSHHALRLRPACRGRQAVTQGYLD